MNSDEVIQETDSYDLGSPFGLEFLYGSSPDLAVYEDELRTSEEKAHYYESLAQNHDQPDNLEIAKDCRKRAKALHKKAESLDEELGQPFRKRALELEMLADYRTQGLTDADQKCSTQSEDKSVDLAAWLSTFLPKTNAEKAKFYKGIHEWGPKETVRYNYGKLESERRAEILFVRAQKDRIATSLLADGSYENFCYLLDLADMGNENAADTAAELVERMVENLTQCALRNPKIFQKVAGKLRQWPVMHSPHPQLKIDVELICRKIGLGLDYPLNIDARAKWDQNELGSRVAIKLLEYVEDVRKNPEKYRSFPYTRSALALPPMNKDGAGQEWWKVARSALLHGIPDLTSDKHLASLAQGKATRKFKSRQQQRILERLKTRFLQLFYKEYR